MSNKTQFLSIVDDEFDVVSLFRDALSEIDGMEVFGFTDSTLAFEHFRLNQSHYTLVLSDYRIPVINGMELLKKIKAMKPSVKTLLISAFDVITKYLRNVIMLINFLKNQLK